MGVVEKPIWLQASEVSRNLVSSEFERIQSNTMISVTGINRKGAIRQGGALAWQTKT
jgi:hypothetical protein